MRENQRTGWRHRCALIGLTATAMLAFAATNALAGPQDYYWETGYNWDYRKVVKINKNTAVRTTVGFAHITGGSSSNGLAFTPDGRLWTTFSSINGVSGFGIGTLDTTNGHITQVGSTFTSYIRALEADNAGNLYGLDNTTGGFYKINTTTGAATLLHSGFNAVTDLGFDSTTNTMWENDGGSFYQLDLSNGSRTFMGDLGFTVSGFSFDDTGVIYGTSRSSQGSFFTVDKTDFSTLTWLSSGNLFWPGAGDFGVGPQSIPLPATGLLALVGFGGVFILRRRYGGIN